MKALTAGIIAACGDAVAQGSEGSAATTCDEGENAHVSSPSFSSSSASSIGPRRSWHWRRSLAAFSDGLLLSGPALHFVYALLEAAKLPALACVAVDELFCDPLSTATYLLATSVCEGRALVPLFRRRFWPAMLGGLSTSLIFVPIQYASFRWGPPAWRVLVVNLCDFFWTCVVSRQSHKKSTSSSSREAPLNGGA